MGKCFSTQKKNKNAQTEQQKDQMQNQTIKAQKAVINVMLVESEINEEEVTIRNQNVQNFIYLNDQKVKEYQQQRNNKDRKQVILEKETARKSSAVSTLYGAKENKQKAKKEKINYIEENQVNEVEDSNRKSSKKQQKKPSKEKANEFKQETSSGKLTPKSKDSQKNQNNLKYKKDLAELNAKQTNNDVKIQKESKDQQQEMQKSNQIEEINMQMKMLISNQEQSQQKIQLLDSLSYLKLTVIQAIKFQQTDKKCLQNEYLIGEKGFLNSFQPSDSIYIGLSGDIQLHPEDICEEKQLQIQFMNENFYIIDHGKKLFTLIQITKEKPLKLRNNLLIQLGEQNLFSVLEIQEPQQFTQRIIEDQYLVIEFDSISDSKFQESTQNENPIPKLKIQFLKGEHKNKIFELDSSHNLLLGRSQKCKQGIQFRDMKIQHEHGMQAFKYRIEFNQYHGWIFKDCGSISGSWVVVKDDYTKFENGVTSLPLKIQNKMQFKVGSNTIFQVSIFNAKTIQPKEEEEEKEKAKKIDSQQ